LYDFSFGFSDLSAVSVSIFPSKFGSKTGESHQKYRQGKTRLSEAAFIPRFQRLSCQKNTVRGSQRLDGISKRSIEQTITHRQKRRQVGRLARDSC
jgi:hypothetical protein